jgi:hypothetical protein
MIMQNMVNHMPNNMQLEINLHNLHNMQTAHQYARICTHKNADKMQTNMQKQNAEYVVKYVN